MVDIKSYPHFPVECVEGKETDAPRDKNPAAHHFFKYKLLFQQLQGGRALFGVVIDVHLHLITDVEVTDTQIIEIRNLGESISP